MKVFFRTDAGNVIGAGHVMRCLTLADTLQEAGAACHFICREEVGHMLDYIRERGHHAHSLSPELTWQQAAKATAGIIQQAGGQNPALVTDHYQIDKHWQQLLRPYVGKIMAIDDLADRAHDCDILLDQNMVPNMESRYSNLVPEGCKTHLGPGYALLRPEFMALAQQNKTRTFPPQHIFINFGGGDQFGMTLKTLLALDELDYQGHVTIVAGPMNPDAETLEHRYAQRPNVSFYKSTNKMAELMHKADLAIGAGGGATWERMCLGLPSITITTADNQVPIADCLAEQGLTYYAGKAEDLSIHDLEKALHDALKDPKDIQSISKQTAAFMARGTVTDTSAFWGGLLLSDNTDVPPHANT